MRAVNLLPVEQRRSVRLEANGRLMGLIGFLAVALVAGALYVKAHNNVNSRQTELAQTSANIAKWTETANSYAPFTIEAQQHTQQLSDVRQLVASRFNWAQLLAQLARLMPAHTQLQSMQAMTPAAATAAAGASTSSTSTPGSAIQLSACATSQDVVAQTMVELRKITGISSVTLSSSTASDSTGSSTTSSSGSCSLRFQFQVSLGFAASTSDADAPTSTAATDGSTSSAK